MVAFPMLVLSLNNSPLVTGIVAFAVIAPGVLVYVPAGALVDRWNPRRVMLASELFRGAAIALVVCSLVIFGKHVNIALLILAMVMEEIFEIFFTLADRRYLSGLMERDRAGYNRQAYVEVRTHAVVLAGRPLGPFLFTIRPVLPFLADALSFLFSIGTLVVLRRSDEPARESRRIRAGQLVSDIGPAFSWLKKDRPALLRVILMAATSLVSQALILIFLAAAHSRQLSILAIGAVLAASGAGGAAGSIFSGFLPDKIGRYWLPIQMTAWTLALGFLAMAGTLSAVGSMVTVLVLSITGAIGNVQFRTYLVANVPDGMMGRVTGIAETVTIGCCALGPVIGGAAVQRWGPDGAVGFLFGITATLALLSSLAPGLVSEIRHSVSRAVFTAQRVPVSVHEAVPGNAAVQLPGAADPVVLAEEEPRAATPGGLEQKRRFAADFIAETEPFVVGDEWSTIVENSQIGSDLRQ